MGLAYRAPEIALLTRFAGVKRTMTRLLVVMAMGGRSVSMAFVLLGFGLRISLTLVTSLVSAVCSLMRLWPVLTPGPSLPSRRLVVLGQLLKFVAVNLGVMFPLVRLWIAFVILMLQSTEIVRGEATMLMR